LGDEYDLDPERRGKGSNDGLAAMGDCGPVLSNEPTLRDDAGLVDLRDPQWF